MFSKIMGFGFAVIFITLWACASKPAPEASETRKVAEALATSAPKEGWEAKWEKVLKEANKEGNVVVYGPPFGELRQNLVKSFRDAYPGIELTYVAGRSAEAAVRIKTEHAAGVYTVDMTMGGSFTPLTILREFMTPIPPLLIQPEAKDPKFWRGGKVQFSDKEQELVLEMTQIIRPPVLYNTDLVNPNEIPSFWDLVKPKWKGKIIMQDPRTSGTGMNLATFWYLHPELGLDYMKAFSSNSPVFTRDLRQIAEWTARGKSSMGMAGDSVHATEFQKVGMPLAWAKTMKEGSFASAEGGTVAVLKKVPHPNAVTVFLNWLLTKEGQTVVSRYIEYPSNRMDVPTDHLLKETIPQPGIPYLSFSSEEIVMKQPEIVPRFRDIFAGL